MPRGQFSIRTLLWLTLVAAGLSAAASAVIDSRIPYHVFWSRDGEQTVVVRRYWDGRTTTQSWPRNPAQEP